MVGAFSAFQQSDNDRDLPAIRKNVQGKDAVN